MAPPSIKFMREIKLSRVPATLSLLYSPGIHPNFKDRENLMVGQNAHKVKIQYNLSKRSQDKLYWSFVPETSRSKLPLSSMRNRYKRRWSAAFAEALRNNGLDYHGQKLSSPAATEEPGPPETCLRGTLEIRLVQAVCWEDKDLSNMLRHSDRIVKGLKELDLPTSKTNSRGNGGGFGSRPSRW